MSNRKHTRVAEKECYNMSEKKGYIAGKLFKSGDIRQRLYEGELVRREVPDIDFYNPIENDDINNKKNEPSAEDIFVQDTREILSSDYVLAELDDEDSGTIYELGLCHGVEVVRAELERAAEREQGKKFTLKQVIVALDEVIPKKNIYTHLSDIRSKEAGEYEGKYVPYGYNQYVIGGVERVGEIHVDAESAIGSIREHIEEIKEVDNG